LNLEAIEDLRRSTSGAGAGASSFLSLSPIFLFKAPHILGLAYAGSESGGGAVSSSFLVNPLAIKLNKFLEEPFAGVAAGVV
jgi:hypothetical protein